MRIEYPVWDAMIGFRDENGVFRETQMGHEVREIHAPEVSFIHVEQDIQTTLDALPIEAIAALRAASEGRLFCGNFVEGATFTTTTPGCWLTNVLRAARPELLPIGGTPVSLMAQLLRHHLFGLSFSALAPIEAWLLDKVRHGTLEDAHETLSRIVSAYLDHRPANFELVNPIPDSVFAVPDPTLYPIRLRGSFFGLPAHIEGDLWGTRVMPSPDNNLLGPVFTYPIPPAIHIPEAWMQFEPNPFIVPVREAVQPETPIATFIPVP